MKVPLWMAVKLQQSNKCKIDCPQWLEVSFLKEIIENEKRSKEGLCELPYYFHEILQILSHKVPETIPELDKVKNLASDLFSIRSDKLNKELGNIKTQKYYFKIKNICARELESIRTVTTSILNAKYEYSNLHKEDHKLNELGL